MISTDRFIIEDLTYIPMGSHNPVLNRPYVVNVTDTAVDIITDRLHESRAAKITPNMLNDVASGILQPSAVGYQSGVNHDWISTRRFIFILKVKSFDAMGTEITSYIQGYTNYDGITNTGNIDPQLVHHINNVIETTSVVLQTPLGVIRKEKLYKLYNVFAPAPTNDLYTQRPGDVLENINVLNMSGLVGNEFEAYSANNFLNQHTGGTISSSVDNNIATEYLSKILTTGMLVNKSRDIHLGSYEISEQNSVDSRIPEPSISDNRFLKYLSRVGGFKFTNDTFQFQQLSQIDATIYDRFKLIQLNKDYVNPLMMATPDVGDYWTGQDPVTLKAYSLIEASVSMATKYGFNKLFFTASNMSSVTGTIDVFITNFNSFINLEEQDFYFMLEIFKDKYISEVFLSETNAGTIPTHMEVYIDLLGTSKINLSYGGYPTNWYTIPTTASSLFSPVVTVDREAFDYTTHQLSTVIDTLTTENRFDKPYF